MPRELSLMRGIQGAFHNRVAVEEGHLAGRDSAYLRRNRVVNFITDHEESQQLVVDCGTGIDGLEKYLVQMLSTVPPLARTFLTGGVQRLLRHLPRKTRARRV